MDKKNVFKLIESQLNLLKYPVFNTAKAGAYNFVANDKKHILYHRHKNEIGSLMWHITKDSLSALKTNCDDDVIPCLAFSVFFNDPVTQKDTLFIYASTIDKIYTELDNPYNSAIFYGEKTGNILFKYGSDFERHILKCCADIFTTTFTF